MPDGLGGGYDARIAGPNPWTLGPLGPRAPGYLKGQSADARDREGVAKAGGVLHAYTDSAPSAAEFASGRKSYNNGINVADDGRFHATLFHQLQATGWKVGTVTSVPFDHASPAAMYAQNVHRDDYQDLARDMLGLPDIGHQTGKSERLPGLDVVMGTGFGQETSAKTLKAQGRNGVAGNLYIADADKAAIDVQNGGKYVVVQTETGVNGARALGAAASRAAEGGHRLFGFFGSKTLNHLPYRTADGHYDPAPDLDGRAEAYTPADLVEQPTLADMTRAALTVLGARPDAAVRAVRRGRRRRLRAAPEQPRQRPRRRLQRRGGDPRDPRLGRGAQQLGRVGDDRHRRPRPLPGHRRPQGTDRPRRR